MAKQQSPFGPTLLCITMVFGTFALASNLHSFLSAWRRRLKDEAEAKQRLLCESTTSDATLSARGRRVQAPTVSYIDAVIEAIMEPYDERSNPGGAILLAVAENRLSWDLLLPQLLAPIEVDLPPWMTPLAPLVAPFPPVMKPLPPPATAMSAMAANMEAMPSSAAAAALSAAEAKRSEAAAAASAPVIEAAAAPAATSAPLMVPTAAATAAALPSLAPVFATAAAADMLSYAAPQGTEACRTAVAALFRERICPGVPVSSAEICVCSGGDAVLSHLFTSLLEAGDGLLIPTPYYAAFEHHVGALAGAVLLPMPLAHPRYRLTATALETAYETAEAEGRRPRALLLTNPTNPTGQIYSADELRMALDFCRMRRLHLVSDEIYALSVFPGSIGGRNGRGADGSAGPAAAAAAAAGKAAARPADGVTVTAAGAAALLPRQAARAAAGSGDSNGARFNGRLSHAPNGRLNNAPNHGGGSASAAQFNGRSSGGSNCSGRGGGGGDNSGGSGDGGGSGSNGGGFISIANIANGTLGDYVHVVWGLSKDFGASGLRVGALFSQNAALMRAMGGIGLSTVSGLMQVSGEGRTFSSFFLSSGFFPSCHGHLVLWSTSVQRGHGQSLGFGVNEA
ncbi:unnamed protein product [Phaeothamnion confervicola]